MAEKKTTTADAPAAPATNPEVEVLKAQLAEQQSKLAEAQAKLAEVTAVAASGVPFTGDRLVEYKAKLAAGLEPEQARAVVAAQIKHDESEAAKVTEAAKAK
jgi:hypothetical protein